MQIGLNVENKGSVLAKEQSLCLVISDVQLVARANVVATALETEVAVSSVTSQQLTILLKKTNG